MAVSTWTLEQQYKKLFMFVSRIQHKILIKKTAMKPTLYLTNLKDYQIN